MAGPADRLADMPDPLLEIDRLGVERPHPEGGSMELLRDVSVTIGRGEMVGLVGESGAGKSTLLRAILGFQPAGARTRGEIRFEGRAVRPEGPLRPADLRGRHVALVFQEPTAAMNPVLTVGEQVEEVVRAHRPTGTRREVKRLALELLSRAGLSEPESKAGRHPHRLSGGECQRAMLAMALAGDPALLLADEPTSALDATVQSRILDLLRRCRDELGLAVLLVSHDLGVIAQTCDRAAVLYAGEVVEEAPIGPLLAEPAHPYTQALLRATPRLGAPAPRGEAPTIPGRAPGTTDRPGGCAFHPRCDARMAVCGERHPASYSGADGRPVRCFLAAPDRGAGS